MIWDDGPLMPALCPWRETRASAVHTGGPDRVVDDGRPTGYEPPPFLGFAPTPDPEPETEPLTWPGDNA
ncbi:hypothetical protein [Nocardioides bruguierae]|uniref:Uncharacterized protein n=1 Tax=Nocardioides bruguierae TaxID=2945102 RepID=A0A9X2IH35_9ACTN|nr:hypothetical protein [Nocardioides bruguierae]MCM0622194.1 hypothetical protein [Nocardioides bruguierae]